LVLLRRRMTTSSESNSFRWRKKRRDNMIYSTVSIWSLFYSIPYSPESSNAIFFLFVFLEPHVLWILRDRSS
jgi:hypothetical protein